MSTTSPKRVLTFIFCLYALLSYSQTGSQGNLGFESGSFNGWTGYTWSYSTSVPSINSSPTQVSIPTSRRQMIMSDTTAYDVNTGLALKIIPKGYKYSARIGDMIRNGDPNPRCWQQSIRYTLKVDSTNALFVMRFACVLQYSSMHDNIAEFEPRFRFSLLDENGNKITTSCANYDVYSTSGTVKGFQTYMKPGSSDPIKWRDWTSVGANLLDYIGQTITIEFMTADCTGRYHYGYAYCVAETHPMIIAVQYCSGDTDARLIAPEGFETYAWTDSIGKKVGNEQSLLISSPNEGAMYYCDMVSATGCNVRLSSKVLRYEPNADFKFDLVDCNKLTNTMKFTNIYPVKNGYLTYKWDFGDAQVLSSDTVSHTFTSSGLHKVKLIVSNPPSTCADTVTKTVETFYPPLVKISGDSLYCKDKKTVLRGVGAFRYQWSDGSTGDSILVGKDTTVWMIGYSSVGCYTDTIWKTIKAAPDWTFDVQGNLLYCAGSNTTLTASNAVSYKWNTGETTPSITVNKPGLYSVTGTNQYGCSQTVSLQVVEDPLPNVDFTILPTTIEDKHNTVTCTAAGQPGVNYVWDMGDGHTETGTVIQHKYDINSLLSEYNITLTATNANGCVNTSSKSVNVTLFVPNIFSPNGDGINDKFVPGQQIQVFDRNGLKLYEGKNGWDGTYNGVRVDNDTYYFRITYKNDSGVEKLLKGYVTLKR